MVALMLQANPNLTDAQVRQIVTQTAIAGSLSSSELVDAAPVTSIAPALESSFAFSISEMGEPSLGQLPNLPQ
jgi:hypothetical protein